MIEAAGRQFNAVTAGTPYFPTLEDRIGLTLLETRTFGSGVAYLRYATVHRPRRSPGTATPPSS